MLPEFQHASSWTVLGVLLWAWTDTRGVLGQSCGPRVSARFLRDIPCDMSKSDFCNVPGSGYPWHAVRRYIFENQGLVRRMYGDQRHSLIVVSELEARRLRYDDEPNRAFRTDGGRNPHRVRPNSRYAARLKTPPVASHETEDPAEKTTVPITPTEATPTTARVPVRTPGIMTQVVYHDEPADEPSPELATDARERPDETEATNATQDVPRPTTESFQSTATTVAQPVSDFGPSYAAGEAFTHEPQALLYAESTDHTTSHLHISVLDHNSIDAADAVRPSTESTEAPEVLITTTETPSKKGINACPVKQEVLAPYWANNTRGDVLALLNVYPFEQYIHAEKCAFENHQMFCRDGCRCEQQFRLHRLLAFDPRNECRGIFSDWFRFPSCCVCICYDLGAAGFRAGRFKS